MNIQEKAEQYALTKHNQSQCFDSEREQCIDDYTAGHNEAMRWIPVGERLPPEYVPILFFNEKWYQPFNEKAIRIGFYKEGVYHTSKRFFDVYEHRESINSIEDTPTQWREI